MELIVNIKKKLPGFNLDVDFETENDILGLLGASGCGKSMTLRCIAGLVKPDFGRIVLNNKVLFDSEKGINLPIQDRKIGFLFQNYALFPHMTVEQNIGYALTGYSKSEKKKIIDEKLEIMQIDCLKKSYPSQLSGGQQQRVALARALAVEPEALLLDEPFSALDNHLRTQMIKQMTEILSIYKGSTLFVTHNMEEAYALCKKMVILSEGVKVAYGDKKEIFKSPSSLAAARVTACKNISQAKVISHEVIEAKDWNCKLKVKNISCESVNYIGIRAHHLQIVEETDDNVFQCWPAFTSETPFRRMVYLKLHKKPESNSDYHVQLDISSEEWDILKNKPTPWEIRLSEENLILIKEK